MTRDLFNWFVLKSVCDHYADIEQITKYMEDVGRKCGLRISQEETVQALRELIEMGYVKAWDLTSPSASPPRNINGCRS